MRAVLASTWPLFLGYLFLIMGNGLQGTVLGLRAIIEGFETSTTGLIMTIYYVGFLLGSQYAPRLVAQVGHIRVFAAFASLASVAAVLHSLTDLVPAWMALRFVSGFCMAGLTVVSESWLNDRATNDNRGQLLSVYMLVYILGMAGGQLLLNVADPAGFEPFILVSCLVSIALVPLALSARPAPDFEAPTPLRFRALVQASPLGVAAMIASGASFSSFFGIGAVFAQGIGLDVQGVSLFISAAIIGAFVLQWPVGRLSDRFDRRSVILATTLGASATALAGTLYANGASVALFVVVFLYGGLSVPLYSLAVAYTNDYLEPRQMVAASGGLALLAGTGAVGGPLVSALAMTAMGPAGFFICLAAISAAIAVFSIYRMLRRPARALRDQGPYVAMPVRATPVSAILNPEAVETPPPTAAGTDDPKVPGWC